MPDPYRNKKVGLFVEAKIHSGNKEEKVRLNLFVNPMMKEKLSEDEHKKFLLQELHKVSLEPVSGIFTTNASFSYIDPDALKDFNYGNILVELTIPYCLGIPNDFEMEISVDSKKVNKALIIHKKVWTNKAESDGKKSDETDFFSEDKVTYFNNSIILSPKIPIDPIEGWEQNYTGKNVQRIKDKTGKFRYSHIYLQFSFPTNHVKLNEEKNRNDVILEIENIVFQVTNRLIDTYRLVTGAEHFSRLGRININLIYFINLNKGIHFSTINIETAEMNRSKKELDLIKHLLVSKKPELFELLLLDAKDSFNNLNYPLAVVQSFQALEIYIEDFLTKKLLESGKTVQQVEAYLVKDPNWKTRHRLHKLLKDVSGKSLHERDQLLWTKWNSFYNERNLVIHKGKEIPHKVVNEILETNLEIINLLKVV